MPDSLSRLCDGQIPQITVPVGILRTCTCAGHACQNAMVQLHIVPIRSMCYMLCCDFVLRSHHVQVVELRLILLVGEGAQAVHMALQV